MKHFWIATLLALVTSLVVCPESDGGWRRKRCTVYVQPCPPIVQSGPYAFRYPPAGLGRPFDKRLLTDKRDIPEFTEDFPGGLVPFNLADALFSEPDADTFTVRKHHRGRAKTTFADTAGVVEVFSDLGSLILSLPDDEVMTPLVKTKWDFDRIDLEKRNVRVTAFLFAVKKESDNDYHLIIDDDGDLEEGEKFNVEISGVPTEGPDVDAVRAARDSFKAHFGGSPPKKYKPFIDPPKRVVIEGSLFFDRDHPAGQVGPQGFRPATAWEIHPVKSIQFLKN